MVSFLKSVKKSQGREEDLLNLVNELVSDENWIEITSKKDLQKMATFLCQLNYMAALKVFLLSCCKRIDKMPGDALFYFITRNSDLNISDSDFAKLDQEFSFFKTYLCPFALKKELYTEQLEKQNSIYLKKYNRTKEDLIDKLQFARTQRLEAEVKKTLEKLIEAFPEDPSFIKEKGLYFEKEAARVIEKSNKAYSVKKRSISTPPQHTPLFNADEVYEVIKGSFKSNDLIYLLEIFLLAGEDETALKIINQNISLKDIYFWNFVELLIVKKRYLEALAEIKNMKDVKTTDDQFNYYYFTAICLWNLNDKQTALDTMKSISKVKPNFKQTQVYLNLWQFNDEVA